MPDDPIQLSLRTPLGWKKLALRAVSGEERISRLFRYEVGMDSKQSDIDFAHLVGQPATVRIEPVGGERRQINGIIARFAQEGLTETGRAIYRAEVVPRLWLLGQRSDCRIFQQMSTTDIVAAVLEEHGISDFELRLSETYPAHDFCVQYNETDLSFVSRRLEEAGIFYFFEHRTAGHRLVLGDSPAAFSTDPGEPLGYGDALDGCSLEEMIVPGGAALDDFNFETPSTDLQVSVDSAVAQGGGQRQIFEYPGGYGSRDSGERLAEVRLEERETLRLRLRGETGSAWLVSGRGFELEGHYRDGVDGVWVAERVTRSASSSGYESQFEAVSASAAYRPARSTPRPVIASAQTAVVVGPAGEEIWTDAYGRVKVQFHWDRRGKKDEGSSGWVRVSQAWAGKGWGQLLLPRIGQEVIVGFEEGDPDRPVILGSLYNAEQTPPASLPDERTRSGLTSQSSPGGGGGNELRFEDAAGAEEVYLHARRGLRLTAGGDQSVAVEGARSLSVGGDQSTTVGGELAVEARQADLRSQKELQLAAESLAIEAGSSITLQVGQARLTLESEGIRLEAPVIELTAGRALELRSKATAELAAGSSLDLEAGATLTIQGALVKLN